MNSFVKRPGIELPPYLSRIRSIVADEPVRSAPLTRRVRQKLSHLPFSVLGEGESLPRTDNILYLKNYRGKFVRNCPGTSRYRCCGYKILHIGENCPVGCTYCILQAYFQDNVLKVWANQDDLFSEMEQVFGGGGDKRFRMGTGEFTDSLVLEPITRYTGDLLGFLAGFPNVCLELKSKVVDLSWMGAVKDPGTVLPAWSMNAPEIHTLQEGDAAGLEERLRAARYCAREGFRVCLHFDPVIHFPGWEEGYKQTIDMIFDYLAPEHIAYVSLGSFRCMPALKKIIEENHAQAGYIYNEFITGLDGKMRLLRPLRVRQFSRLVSLLKKGGLGPELYLCMESDQLWQAVFGYTPRALGGLQNHLLNLAFSSSRW